MRRVLIHGEVAPEQTICWSCGCAFEFCDLDVNMPSRMDGDDSIRFVKCPDCGQPLFLGPKGPEGGLTRCINGGDDAHGVRSDNLLPSPFSACAGKPEVFRDEVSGVWHLLATGGDVLVTIRGSSKEDVVAKWNSRRA